MATEPNSSPQHIREPETKTADLRSKEINSLLSRESGRIQDEMALSEMTLVDNLEEYYDYDVPVEIRFLISARHAGGIIGKGGSYINEIRDETDTEFHIHQAVPNSPLRTGSCRGRVREVVRALLLMGDKVTELQKSSRHISRDFAFQYGDYNLTLLLEHKNCGVIIGKCGARISCNRQRSGAHIKISTHVLENSSEKTIDIQGRRDSVENALETLIVQIANDPKPNQTQRKYLDESIKPHQAFDTKFDGFGNKGVGGRVYNTSRSGHQNYFGYFPQPNHHDQMQHPRNSARNQQHQTPQPLSGPMNNLYGYWGPYQAYSQSFTNPNPNHWNNNLHQYNNNSNRDNAETTYAAQQVTHKRSYH